MPSLLDYWTTRLQEDLAGFADPETGVTVALDGNELRATWEQRSEVRDERFRLSQVGDFRWIDAGGQSAHYATFLRSSGMADFGQLAKAIARVFSPVEDFVATDARMEQPSGEEVGLEASPEALRGSIIEARRTLDGRTSLYFIKGEAGAGKTTLLRELTGAQARKYLQDEAGFLFLYVSAQGRALSNLRDALSGELQDLRAGFTRDAVPALVREGLIVPVIDGFDELLGAAGYGDAFNSLRQFLTELQGRGVVLVSARSAFYNLEFISRAPEVSEADLSLRPVSLLPWDDEKLYRYLGQRARTEQPRYQQAVGQLDARDRALLTKPFFASEFPAYVETVRDVDASPSSLLTFLIDAYIARETQKILGASGEPLLSKDGHRQLLEEAAEYMWQSETRQLSAEELRTLVELVAEGEGLAGDEARQLITKVTSAAGFRTRTGQATAQFTFDHEVYFEFFLSNALARHLRHPTQLGLFFDRGILPPDAVRTACAADAGHDLVGTVQATTSAALRHENRRRNAGACIAAHAQGGPVEDVTIRNVAFVDVDFGLACFQRVEFENCDFTGSRLDRARFEACDATTSRFSSVVVTNKSRLDFKGIVPGANFGSLIHPDVSDEVFSPKEVAEVLARLGTPGGASAPTVRYSAKAEVLIKLLQIMARAYRRANVLFESDEYLSKLFSSKHWPALRDALTEHGVVREESRAVAGPKVNVYRLLVKLDELVSGENAVRLPAGSVGEFWSAMRAV
jgi:NACHT domain